jgi:hypothetical protein
MDITPNLTMPYILPSQAQKHVTHNDALRVIDTIVQLCILTRNLAIPPETANDGDRYLVADEAGGEWSSQDGKLAVMLDGAWYFHQPVAGWRLWVADENRLLIYNGSVWSDIFEHISQLQHMAMLGIGVAADATNRFSVQSPAILLDRQTDHMRVKLNKETAADTVSLLYQSGYSSRVEAGLLGENNYTINVSADGINFTTAMQANHLDGSVILPKNPKFSAFLDYNQYLPADDWTPIKFNNSRHNDQLAFDPVSGLFTAPHDGCYQFSVSCMVDWGDPAPTEILIGLGIDGAPPETDLISACRSSALAAGSVQLQLSAFLQLDAGQTMEVQMNPADFDGNLRANASRFWGCQIA